MDKLKAVHAIITDVDGVLTDGRIHLLPDGEEVKVFHSRDGSAIRVAIRQGIAVAFLSGRGSRALEVRAKELGVTHLIQHSRDKGSDLDILLEELDLTAESVAFIGDDLVDLPAIERVGFSACPSDAAAEVKARVDLVLSTPGGCGVLREAVELILKARGAWPY